MSSFPKLFIPGPTHVPENVMQSMTSPQIGHRTPEFSELMSIIVSGIQKVLYTKNHIYLASHSGTGLWEMGIQNSVKKGILNTINGSFSSKWALVSKECGHQTGVLEYDWGKGIKARDIDKLLSTGNYDVLAMVHNETSTGVLSPLEPISEMLKSKYPDVIWLVDAVSSMAGVKIEVDKLGVDFLMASTQKAWGLPAGFSVCSVSRRLIELSKTISNKGYFLDIGAYEKYYEKMQTPSTPSIPHMYGLKYILKEIEKEGLESRWLRHIENAKFTRDWALDRGQSLFPEKGYESETITCIQNDMNWDIEKVNKKLLQKSFRMDRGYGKLRGQAFRIAHMGNVKRSDLEEYLYVFDEVLNG